MHLAQEFRAMNGEILRRARELSMSDSHRLFVELRRPNRISETVGAGVQSNEVSFQFLAMSSKYVLEFELLIIS